jgi:hypothetical protein
MWRRVCFCTYLAKYIVIWGLTAKIKEPEEQPLLGNNFLSTQQYQRHDSNIYSCNTRRAVGSLVFGVVHPYSLVTVISQLREKVFSVGFVQRLCLENQMKLKPRMVVLVKTSNNLTNQPQPAIPSLERVCRQDRPVHVWGCCRWGRGGRQRISPLFYVIV